MVSTLLIKYDNFLHENIVGLEKWLQYKVNYLNNEVTKSQKAAPKPEPKSGGGGINESPLFVVDTSTARHPGSSLDRTHIVFSGK